MNRDLPLGTALRLCSRAVAPARRTSRRSPFLFPFPPSAAGATAWSSSTSSVANKTSVVTRGHAPARGHGAANPPATTRPPPLDLPVRQPDTTTFHHLFATGKAYLTFYKTGLKQIYTNYRLLSPSSSSSASPSSSPQVVPPAPGTRAALLLAARVRHDMRRLPLFALLLLVCGEFTPFVVLAIPSIVPFTCRIPKQVAKLRREAEARRARVIDDFRYHHQQTTDQQQEQQQQHQPNVATTAGYLARVLGVASPFWDRIGLTLPGSMVGRRVRSRLKFLAEDDRLLIEAGGVEVLEADEVGLACVDRCIETTGRDEQALRRVLDRWLQLAAPEGLPEEERENRMAKLLLSTEREWSSFK